MRRWRASALVAVIVVGGGLASVRAENRLPYRLWWSFPNDDDSAIELPPSCSPLVCHQTRRSWTEHATTSSLRKPIGAGVCSC